MINRIIFRTALILGLSQTAAMAQVNTVYIAEGSSDTIQIVRADTGELIRRLTGFEAVHGLAGTPGAKYIVAGSYSEIEREDIEALSAPSDVTEDEHAAHHQKPNKAVGPADAGISIVSIIEVESGEVVRRVEVPGAVHHVAMSPDGRYAVATHPVGDGISVIDLNSLSLLAFIPTGPLPNYAAFGADPSVVYVSNTGNGTISEVDLKQEFVARNFPIGDAPEHLTIDADAERLFVADSDAGIAYEVALGSGEVIREFPIGGEIHGIGVSDDGNTVFVSGKSDDKLAAINLATGKVRSVTLAPNPYHLAIIPGTGMLYVSSRSEPTVWVIDQMTLALRTQFEVQGEGHQMVAMP